MAAEETPSELGGGALAALSDSATTTSLVASKRCRRSGPRPAATNDRSGAAAARANGRLSAQQGPRALPCGGCRDHNLDRSIQHSPPAHKRGINLVSAIIFVEASPNRCLRFPDHTKGPYLFISFHSGLEFLVQPSGRPNFGV
jgi:hypothetical protein